MSGLTATVLAGWPTTPRGVMLGIPNNTAHGLVATLRLAKVCQLQTWTAKTWEILVTQSLVLPLPLRVTQPAAAAMTVMLVPLLASSLLCSSLVQPSPVACVRVRKVVSCHCTRLCGRDCGHETASLAAPCISGQIDRPLMVKHTRMKKTMATFLWRLCLPLPKLLMPLPPPPPATTTTMEQMLAKTTR